MGSRQAQFGQVVLALVSTRDEQLFTVQKVVNNLNSSGEVSAQFHAAILAFLEGWRPVADLEKSAVERIEKALKSIGKYWISKSARAEGGWQVDVGQVGQLTAFLRVIIDAAHYQRPIAWGHIKPGNVFEHMGSCSNVYLLDHEVDWVIFHVSNYLNSL